METTGIAAQIQNSGTNDRPGFDFKTPRWRCQGNASRFFCTKIFLGTSSQIHSTDATKYKDNLKHIIFKISIWQFFTNNKKRKYYLGFYSKILLPK